MTLDTIDKAILEAKDENEKLINDEQVVIEEIENLKNASLEERSQNRVVFGCLPYVLAGAAAVGLSHFGYVDPNWTGAITLGAGAIAGSAIEDHLVRKIVDSKTLSDSAYHNLRSRVYKTIEKEKIIQKEITNTSKMNSLLSARLGEFEFTADALNEKRCVEDVLDSLALKIALVQNDCSSYVQFNTVAKEALTALGIYGAYMFPLSISNAEINGTQFMIPTAAALLSIINKASYESIKRKINKKYHNLMRYEIDTDSLIELKDLTNDYASRLGKIEAKLLLMDKSEEEAPVVDTEDDSLFLQVWNEISEEKEKGLYRSKSNK